MKFDFGILDLMAYSKQAPFIIFGFLLFLTYVRYIARKNVVKAEKTFEKVALVASQHFKTQSTHIKTADWNTHRWVATNWGHAHRFRYFRAVLLQKELHNPLYFLLNYIKPQIQKLQIELKFKATFEAYACVVTPKLVKQYIKQNKSIISMLSPVKLAKNQPQDKVQRCESFQGLIEQIISTLNEDFKSNLQQLTLKSDQLILTIKIHNNNLLIDQMQQIFNLGDKLMNFQLNDQQQRQNKKKLEVAEKHHKMLQTQKQLEQDEQDVEKRIQDLYASLENPNTTAQEKQKVELRLESYKKKERERASRRYMSLMNMGGGNDKKFGKQKGMVVMK